MARYYVELRWTCPDGMCAHDNPGSALVCGGCGRPKKTDVEDHDADDMSPAAAVTDAGKLRDASSGPLLRCRFCDYAKRQTSVTCAQCGAPMEAVAGSAADGHVSAASTPIAAPRSTKRTTYRTGRERPEPMGFPPPPIDSGRRVIDYDLERDIAGMHRDLRRRGLVGPVASVCAGVAALVTFMAWLFWPRVLDATVTAVAWEHAYVVERYAVHPHEGWLDDRSSNAFEVTGQEQRQDGTRKVFDHNDTVPYQDCVRQPDRCTPRPSSCRRPDPVCTRPPDVCTKVAPICTKQKNGYAACDTQPDRCERQQEVCTPATGPDICTPVADRCEHVDDICTTRTRQEPVYRQEPVFRTWAHWKLWEWAPQRRVAAAGNTTETRWPDEADVRLKADLAPGEDERVRREVSYHVTLRADGRSYTYTLATLAAFKALPVGTRLSIQVSPGGGVQLLPAGAR